MTINIQGGRRPGNWTPSDEENYGGDATVWFNEPISRVGLVNTLASRAMDRGQNLQALGAQEVCPNNWYWTTYEMRAWYAISSDPLAFREVAAPSVTGGLSDGCGAWYGNALLVRGAMVANSGTVPYGTQSGERAKFELSARLALSE